MPPIPSCVWVRLTVQTSRFYVKNLQKPVAQLVQLERTNNIVRNNEETKILPVSLACCIAAARVIKVSWE